MATHRTMGQQCDALGMAVARHSVVKMRRVENVAAVLHAHDGHDASSLDDLLDGHVRDPHMLDLAGLLEIPEYANAFGERHVIIRCVKLVELDQSLLLEARV